MVPRRREEFNVHVGQERKGGDLITESHEGRVVHQLDDRQIKIMGRRKDVS